MGRPRTRSLLIALLLYAFVPAVQAAGAIEHLHAFFQDMRSLEARFDQTIVQEGQVIQRTSGELQIVRPGKFRWAYEEPFEQLIITDGATLWVYEPDLEQVTVSPLDTSVGNTPAMLLSTEEPLEDLFVIIDAGWEDGLDWVVLEPRGEEAAFERIFLGFDTGLLATMEILDAFNQTVRIRFSGLRRNPDLAPSLFEFEAPEGIDVIRD